MNERDIKIISLVSSVVTMLRQTDDLEITRIVLATANEILTAWPPAPSVPQSGFVEHLQQQQREAKEQS